MSRRFLILLLCAGSLNGMVSRLSLADPSEGPLLIDGEIEMITRTESVDGHPFPEVISGWHYRTESTRALQADSFENPGMLAVEEGEDLWNTVEGTEGKSCASCHDDASVSMVSAASSYPGWDRENGKPINIEQRINRCRVENMGAEAYAFDEDRQKSLTAFIKNQAMGEPVRIDVDEGEMQVWWERGRQVYYTRKGQLDLSCASCHERNNGKHIRADHLSQGNVNGFPTYRLKQSALVSLHNRFRGCIRDTRAEIPDAFSDELMALEVYTTWRSQGLSVETPAVRQ
ncbi:sulfur oxidation c-type cytochrome SoxA [Granulosicoccus sp. 3-233]|uniref:sulfur oxidation c-type cytochrome SoxA n=1 Tax=Granulosicoccus sp. 3-233 TaxID=3417969 RepID=UPI003D32B976